MARYRQVNNLSVSQAAYIAGLIDGEGSVGLLRKHKGDNRQLVISIANNELALLEFVLEVIGAGKITHKRPIAAAHNESYTYTITNRQALSVLEQTYRFLRTYKSRRAQLILDDYLKLTPRNGKYSPEIKSKRERFIERCMAIKA